MKNTSVTVSSYFFLIPFSGDKYVATLTLGGAGAHATYYHQVIDRVNLQKYQCCDKFANRNPLYIQRCSSWLLGLLTQLQMGVEFEASRRMQETTTSFGYQVDIPEVNLVFKGKFMWIFLFASIVYTKM